jgi:hypothetical protein
LTDTIIGEPTPGYYLCRYLNGYQSNSCYILSIEYLEAGDFMIFASCEEWEKWSQEAVEKYGCPAVVSLMPK